MSVSIIKTYYAIIRDSDKTVVGPNTITYLSNQDPPSPSPTPGHTQYLLDGETLGGTPVTEFLSSHKPVFSGSQLVGWTPRPALAHTVVKEATSDGRVAGVLSLSGPHGARFTVRSAANLATHLSEGQFDGSGMAELRFKAFGGGPFFLEISPDDTDEFQALHLSITPTPGSF